MMRKWIKKFLLIFGCAFFLVSCTDTSSSYVEPKLEKDESNKFYFDEETFLEDYFANVNEDSLKSKLLEPYSGIDGFNMNLFFKSGKNGKRWCYLKNDGSCVDTERYYWAEVFDFASGTYEEFDAVFVYDIRKTTKLEVFYDLTGLFGIVAINDYKKTPSDDHFTEVVGYDMSDSFTVINKITYSLDPNVSNLQYTSERYNRKEHYKNLYTILFFDIDQDMDFWIFKLKSMTYFEQSCKKMNSAFTRFFGNATCKVEGNLEKHTSSIEDEQVLIAFKGYKVANYEKITKDNKLTDAYLMLDQVGYVDELYEAFAEYDSFPSITQSVLVNYDYSSYSKAISSSLTTPSSKSDTIKSFDFNSLLKRKYYVILKNRGINTTNLIVESLYFNIDGTERFSYVNDTLFRNAPFDFGQWLKDTFNIPSALVIPIIILLILLLLMVIFRLFGISFKEIFKFIYRVLYEIVRLPLTIYEAFKLVMAKSKKHREDVKKARKHAEYVDEQRSKQLDVMLKIKQVKDVK